METSQPPQASWDDQIRYFHRILEEGDADLAGIRQNVDIFVGLSRKGKSTFFNVVNKKKLIGQGNKFVCNYIPMSQEDKDVAQLGLTFQSVTLKPNICHIDDKTTRIDFAGFGDTRDFIGVMGVSYFLQGAFNHIKNVRIVIVEEENSLYENMGESLKKTFTNFANLFNMDIIKKMNKDEKESFFSSISMIFTKSKKAEEHRDAFEYIIQQLQKVTLQNKEFIIELLTNIYNRNLITDFAMAKPNVQCPESDHLQNLTKKGFKYFEIGKFMDLISLPFVKEKQSMKETQQAKLENAIEARIKSYLGFSDILKTLVEECILNNWKNKPINFDKFFASITTYLSQNDYYNSSDKINEQDLKTRNKLNLVSVIKETLKIHEIAFNLQSPFEIQQDKIKQLEFLKGRINEILNVLHSFCMTIQEDTLVHRLSFVMNRGIVEFQRFFQIDPLIASDSYYRIKDKICIFFQEEKKQFTEIFFKDTRKADLAFLFKTDEELQQFARILYLHQKQFQGCYGEDGCFNQLKIDIKNQMMVYEYKLGKYNKCILEALQNCFSLIKKQKIVQASEQMDNESKENQIQELEMNKIECIFIISECVSKKGNLNLFYSTINLLKAVSLPNKACLLFKQMNKKYLDDNKKKDYVQNSISYADYCIQIGRFEDANKILQEILDIQRNRGKYKEIIDALRYRLTEDKDTSFQNYKLLIDKWKKLQSDEESVKKYLEQLQTVVEAEKLNTSTSQSVNPEKISNRQNSFEKRINGEQIFEEPIVTQEVC